jgi:hypothetical protein
MPCSFCQEVISRTSAEAFFSSSWATSSALKKLSQRKSGALLFSPAQARLTVM